MTVPTGSIDLGELPRDRQPDVAAPWPVLARLRRWHRRDRRRTGRLAGTAAVTVLVLLTATGAAAPPRPAFQPHFTVPDTVGFVYDQQRLYVVEAAEPDRTRVVAYRLADGAVRWRVPLPASEQTWPVLENGVLLFQIHRGPAGTTVALDPGSGRELWRRPDADLLDTTAGGRFVFSDFGSGSGPTGHAPLVHLFTGVDPATGRVAWTMPVTGVDYTHGYPDSRYLVAYSRHSGDIHSHDLATGRRLASRSLPSADTGDVQVVGSLALVRQPPELAAYDIATLEPMWTISGPDDRTMWPTSCGELLCLIGEQPPRALDPATGEPVWTADWLPELDQGNGILTVADPPGDRLAGHLLVTEQPRRRSWLVDAGTGQPVLNLDRWRLVQSWPPVAGPGPPLLVWPGADGPVVGRLRPDLSGVEQLGQIGAPANSTCLPVAGYAFCQTDPADGEQPRELVVWRDQLA